MSDYVCKNCWPTAEEIGEISPGYGLVLFGGYFHIVGGDHKQDILVTFDNTPSPDPNPDGDKSPDAKAAKTAWLKEVKREMDGKLNFPLDRGHHFIQSLISAGWSAKHRTYTTFIYNKVGTLINSKVNELVKVPETTVQ